MAFPWLIAGALGLGFTLFAGGKAAAADEAPHRWGPELGADGIQRVPWSARAAILHELAGRGAAPAGEHAIVVSGATAQVQAASVGAWLASEQAAGRAILINVLGGGDAGAAAELLAVAPGELAQRAGSGSRWAVLAEGYGAPAAALPGAPWAEAPPVAPAPAVPAGMPLEAQIQALPPGLKETISGALKNAATQGETLRVLADAIRNQFPAIAAELEKEATRRKTEQQPASAEHVHVVRLDGDTPYRLALHFTGDGARWRELLGLNNLQAVKDPVTGYTLAQPWAIGQRVILPTSWNMNKGPMPRGEVLRGELQSPKVIADRIASELRKEVPEITPAALEGDDVGAVPALQKLQQQQRRRKLSTQLKELKRARGDRDLRKKILGKRGAIGRLQKESDQGSDIATAILQLVMELQQLQAQEDAPADAPADEAPAEPPPGYEFVPEGA